MKRILFLAMVVYSIDGIAQTAFVLAEPLKTHSAYEAGLLKGQITTADGQPAAGVSVLVLGTNKFAISDDNGFFAIHGLPEGVYTLSISLKGTKSVERTAEIKRDGNNVFDIVITQEGKQLSEVVITAGKRLNQRPVAIGKVSIHPMDLPQSMAIIGQGLIKQQQALRLSDVIKNANGVYLAGTRASTQESFSARGYSFGSNNLFRNGVRINSGSLPEVGGLERVEILKGSAAILYGQVAPGES